MSDGGKSQEPVREVVQRTVVHTVVRQEPAPSVIRPAQRLSGEPYTLPEDAVEWIEALAALRRDIANPKIYPFREYVARACERTLEALRDDDAPHPPGPPSRNTP